jgi:hypothetical protein
MTFYSQSNILLTACELRSHARAICVLSRAPLSGLLASEGRIIYAAENAWTRGLNSGPRLWYQVKRPHLPV